VAVNGSILYLALVLVHILAPETCILVDNFEPLRIAAMKAEDLRCKGLITGVVVEMEDPRCKSAAIEMEDPRCRGLNRAL
jgi:hypothetical protein